MELRVDGALCDLGMATPPAWSWSADRMRTSEGMRQGETFRMEIPSTPQNDRIFGYAITPHPAERFNQTLHRAEIWQEGARLFSGVIRLRGVRPEVGDRAYEVELRGGAAEWCETAARSSLEELVIDFSTLLTPSAICASWQGESPVVFLPLIHDDYQAPYSSSSLQPVERILSVDDYHPFLHVQSVLEQIFAQAGYTLESDFVRSNEFRSLYISGAYSSSDVEARRKRFDFLARRSGAVEAVADSSGRVYASADMVVNSVGNLVDCFSPQGVDDEGNPLSECFSTGGCLSLESETLTFRPTSELLVGFEYHLRYESDYRILSRTRLAGFDSLYLGTEADFRFELANRFEDRRGNLSEGQTYRLVVFDHQEGAQYRFVSLGYMQTFSNRTTLVKPSAKMNPILQCYDPTQETWNLYTGDWALYDGYIEETGKTEVELTLRTAPEQVGPQSPKRFNNLYFYGADPGMTFRLLKGTSLRPVFSSQPAFGEQLSWSDLSQLGIRQSELIDALAHLFNWCIFTDETQKRVFIEPQEAFYRQDQVTDWSNRVLLDEEILLEEWDSEQHASRRYGYRRGDGTVDRLSEEQGEAFGDWVAHSPSQATLQGEELRHNPLFTATLNRSGYFETAPSASVPVVGNRDDLEAVERHVFLPRILRYEGLKSLPDGERWGFPAPEGYYPFATFHSPKEGDDEAGFTLCFEDRDGVAGLNRYYQTTEEIFARAERLHLTLCLHPDEVVALAHRSTEEEAGCDALFRLRLGGEPLRCRLEAVKHYDPQTHRARCTFLCLNDDRP